MNNDNKNLTQIDDKIIVEFVKVMPYPNYEEMLEKLDNNIELWCEYGKKNHICCKKIYENPTNRNLIIEMGKKIYEMGGLQALLANHTIIKNFSPYSSSTNIIIKMQERVIKEYFKEVYSK